MRESKLLPKVSAPSCYFNAEEQLSYIGYPCEVMSVIRMIKLFGWEGRMATQLDQKREAELQSVRRTRILNSCIGLFK